MKATAIPRERARKPSLTARMAALLDRMSFGLVLVVAQSSPDRRHGAALSDREALEPAVRLMQEQAAELIAEHQRRGGAS